MIQCTTFKGSGFWHKQPQWTFKDYEIHKICSLTPNNSSHITIAKFKLFQKEVKHVQRIGIDSACNRVPEQTKTTAR